MKKMVDAGQYFTIHRARQYGKTTLLRAFADYLAKDYAVVRLDFQMIETDEFASGSSFVHALAREIGKRICGREDVSDVIKRRWTELADCG